MLVSISCITAISRESSTAAEGSRDERGWIGAHDLQQDFNDILLIFIGRLGVEEGNKTENGLDSNGDLFVSSSFEESGSEGEEEVLA
jgi:hypothetical protein